MSRLFTVSSAENNRQSRMFVALPLYQASGELKMLLTSVMKLAIDILPSDLSASRWIGTGGDW